MKSILTAFSMCQTMFCALPCPLRLWDDRARHRMLLFLPLIGAELGALQLLLTRVCVWLSVPAALKGVLLCAAPFLLTGFIHLDGFMDVTDAVRSYRPLERRREILKDSHVGSFAVIGVVLLMLCQFAVFFTLDGSKLRYELIFLPAVSRCCSALAVDVLPPMHTSQYAAERAPRSHIVALSVLLAALLSGCFALCGRGGFAALVCTAGYGAALLRAYRSLRGMNGDISGYSLTLAELAGYAALCFV